MLNCRESITKPGENKIEEINMIISGETKETDFYSRKTFYLPNQIYLRQSIENFYWSYELWADENLGMLSNTR